jgi:hypothetical protein
MIEGTLLAESLRVGATLDDLALRIRSISRYRVQGATDDQPDVWTALELEADEPEATSLAEAFADVLDQPGWYANCLRGTRGRRPRLLCDRVSACVTAAP